MWNGDFSSLLEAPFLSWLSTETGETSGNVACRDSSQLPVSRLDFPPPQL